MAFKYKNRSPPELTMFWANTKKFWEQHDQSPTSTQSPKHHLSISKPFSPSNSIFIYFQSFNPNPFQIPSSPRAAAFSVAGDGKASNFAAGTADRFPAWGTSQIAVLPTSGSYPTKRLEKRDFSAVCLEVLSKQGSSGIVARYLVLSLHYPSRL